MSLLKKNILLLVLMQGANYLIPLITFPYLTRVLGVSQFGVYTYVLTLSQYFILITDFGFNLSASKKIAQADKNRAVINKIFWSTLSAKALIGLSCIGVLLVLYSFNIDKPEGSGLIYIMLTIVGAVFTPVWFFQGVEEISALTVTNIISKTSAIPLVILLVNGPSDVDLAILVQGIVYLLAASISMLLVYRTGYISAAKISFYSTLNQLKDSLPLFISTIAISLYTMSTPIIIKLVNNSYEVGLYSGADKLRGALIGIFLVVGSALYPRINNLFATDKVKMYDLLRKVILAKLIFSILVIFIVYLFSPLLVNVILGPEFIRSADVLKVMSIQFFTVLMSVAMANYLLLPFGFRKEYMLLPIFTCILHCVLCYYLATKYGAMGGAISVTLVELCSMCVLFFITYKKGLLKGFIR
ncbi:flippase [Aeromonas veronii]|uniref:flippase n=1 Tax=Aeromonas veronii TaxID=654 RepID=UPI001F2A8201|nr:flippase [Aeromonas veronii]MCF5869649.1 flippase [Aeromonas veronii]